MQIGRHIFFMLSGGQLCHAWIEDFYHGRGEEEVGYRPLLN